jgi:hypothetical protein
VAKISASSDNAKMQTRQEAPSKNSKAHFQVHGWWTRPKRDPSILKLGQSIWHSYWQFSSQRRSALALIFVTLSILVATGCAGGVGASQLGLTVSPSMISTGSVAIGNTKTQAVTLTNTTSGTLTVKRAALIGDGFKAPGLPLLFSLPSGQSFSFDLQFAPTSAGRITGSLSLTSNPPLIPISIVLSGSGVANPLPPPPGPPSVTVTLAPPSANILAGASLQFTEAVSGSSNTGVTWAVNGVTGGSSVFGSISPTGSYAAPASLPTPATVKVTVTSVASNSASASSSVTLTDPSVSPGGPVGSPVLNVLDYGATVNNNVDATAAINKTVAAVPASGGTVYLPTGTYAIKSRGTVPTINRAHVKFDCAPGAILQAQTGFLGGFPILDIQGSAADVQVAGCVFDGNRISGQGFQIDGGAAGILIDHVESKNQTGTAGRGTLRTGGLVQITNSYFHDDPTGYYDFAGIGGTPSLRFDSNHCDVITGNPNGICAGSSGLNFFEASNNVFTNTTAGREAVLYCFGCDKVDWQHNNFTNVTAAVHCDTCGGGIISFNTATNDVAVGFPDYFVEVGSNFIVEGNVSTNKTGERGMVLGVGSNSQGPAALRSQVSSFDSTTGFTAGSNATVSTDNADKQEGTGSMVATASGSFTTGTLWYFNFGSPQTFWVPYQDIWIEPTSGALAAGQLQLCLSVNTAISTCDLRINLPAVAQGTWYRVIAYGTGWEGALAINGQASPGFNSFGVRVTTSSPGLIVKFDDFDKADELVGYVARSNTIVNPASACISFGALQGGLIADNTCQNPIGGSNIAYIDENSAEVTFTGNTSKFSAGRAGSVHLLADGRAGAATVTASGDQTNAATMFSSTDGGQIAPGP